jgi:biotin-(acetyl-CoA carboxylase) ligase
MSSLRELSGRPVDRDALLEAWLDRLEPRSLALRAGRFDAGAWSTRQRTTGRRVEVEIGGRRVAGTGEGVDPARGSLLLRAAPSGELVRVDSGEVTHCRIVELPVRRG